MTSAEPWMERVEQELRHSGGVSPALCADLEASSSPFAEAFQRALAFLGCEIVRAGRDHRLATEDERVAATRLMLLKLQSHTAAPRWSSFVLDRLVDATMGTPGAHVTDVVVALHALLGELGSEMNREVANLVRDLIVTMFRRFAGQFVDAHYLDALRRVIDSTQALAPAQAYLVMHALPEAAQPQYRGRILEALRDTPCAAEARQFLEP